MKSNLNYNGGYLLDEKVNFYKKILNQIPDLIFVLTISPTNEFYFPYLNEKLINYFEITDEELQSNPLDVVTKRIYPADREGFFESLYHAIQTNTSWSYEFRVVSKRFELQWFNVDATLEIDEDNYKNFFCNLTNITVIKSSEIKAQESETRYQFALEASNKGIWDYNLATGKVYFSKESLGILQFTEEDEINTNSKWDERIHPDDIIDYTNSFQLHKENKIPLFESTKRVLAKDGSYKWVLSRGKIIERDENGNPLRIIGTHSDVSLNKEKEAELLNNLDIIIEQNNRLLNFAHIVSHNLRSHTGNFKMLLNLIKESESQEDANEYIGYLNTTSNALSETIDHLKELVDIQSAVVHKKEELNLTVYLNHTLGVLNQEIRDNEVVIVNNIGEKDTIKYNPAYLESLFLNFTTNAIKYAHPDRKPVINYSFFKENNKLILLISDNGLGIDLTKHGQKMFGMYKTFHKNENARGIGLFITKNQIESMGGTIEVESEVNVGTTFKIKFNEEIQ